MLEAFQLAANRQRFTEYITRSDYWMQLQSYTRLFGKEQVYLLTLEDLIRDPTTTFRRLFEWLDVDSRAQINTSQKHNVGGAKLRQTRRGLTTLEAKIKYSPKWKKLSSTFPKVLENTKNRLIYRTVERQNAATLPCVELLKPLLAESVQLLSDNTDVDTSSWVNFRGE